MRIEHLDDLPALSSYIHQTDLVTLLESTFKDHGHWKGLSGGKVIFTWLLYLLSEGDHRLSHMEDWAEQRLNILSAILKEENLRSIDFCDDRLGRLLNRFSKDEDWIAFEALLGKRLIQVYEIDDKEDCIQVIRSDSFNAPQFREKGELFKHGYSKQRRGDQTFCKVMMSALDPLAMPLAVDVVKGSGPDSNLYLPVIKRVQSIFKKKGNLYVGDSHLGSLSNRREIHLSGDYYLTPLNKKQISVEDLGKYLDQIKVPYDELPSIFTEFESKRKPAYYHELWEEIEDKENELKWEERRILVYSPDYARGLLNSFNNRLDEAEEKIKNLVDSKMGRRNPKTLADLNIRIGLIIKKYKLEGCFEIVCSESVEQKKVRRHKNRLSEVREIRTLSIDLRREIAGIELKRKRLGWQVYGTNVPVEKIETGDLVKTYRDEYRIEHLFDYLINRDVGLLPIYLKKENRVKGLIRLLSLGMRFSMLIQHTTRTSLEEKKGSLKGIYPGNKGRATNRPTTPMLLRAFKGISMAWLNNEQIKIIQMTPIKEKQKEILDLMKIPEAYQEVINFLEVRKLLRET